MSYSLDLIFYKAMSDLRSECGRSFGGAVWWILDPLLSIIVYYIAFGLILNRGDRGFVAFLCVGIIFWRWFQSSIARGAGSILSESALIGKVYMPKYIFPTVSLLGDVFKFAFTLILLILFLWAAGYTPGTAYLALPVVLVIQLTFMAAFVGFTAAIVPFFPDLHNLLNHALHLLFFVSGIFFSVDDLSAGIRIVVLLNPMAGLISAYRTVMIDNASPDWHYLTIVMAVSLVGVWLAYLLLRYYDRMYAKVC